MIGYGEQTSYHDDLCILSAYGTAVLLKLPDALGPGAGAGSPRGRRRKPRGEGGENGGGLPGLPSLGTGF